MKNDWRTSIPYLGFALILICGCRAKSTFYSQNQSLVRLLDAQDKISNPDIKYVLHGDGNNLFYLEDFRAAIIKWNFMKRNIDIIRQISDSLKSKGVELLVVPVPTKVETYPELLHGRDVQDISPSKNI